MAKTYIPGESKEQRKARKRQEKDGRNNADNSISVSTSRASNPISIPTNKQVESNVIACLKWGNKYSAKYVNNLYNMVKRNCTVDYEFVCFTEDSKDINSEITIQPLPVSPVTGWWFKPYMLSNKIPYKGTLLFLDIDVIVFKNIDKLFAWEPNQFLICKDFNRSLRSNWDRMNSSVFRTPIGKYEHLYDEFIRNVNFHTSKNRGDQDWMYREIKDHKFFPDEWAMSYKWEMRDRRDLTMDANRKRNFSLDAPPIINNQTCIAVFHGDPNPEHANDSWVKQHWG